MKNPRGGQKFVVVLAWWTFAGTVISVIGLFVNVPQSAFLWPTMIRPHWAGALVGALAFFVLGAIYQARSARPDPELQAARAAVASTLRAHIERQQAQRSE